MTGSTRLGALTTTYTPSGTQCNSIHYDTNPTPPGWFVLGAIAEDSTDCYPAGYTRVPEYYYSPGICPSGYTVACQTEGTTYSTVTTVATCCPTGGYACFANRGEDIYGCTSLVTEDTVMTLLSVDFQTTSDSSTTVYNVASGTITTTILALSNSIQAYGVIVERQSTDPSFVAASTTSTSSAASTSTSSTASSTATSAATTAASTSGLSVGAQAGIGIGIAVGVIGLLALAFACFRRRRREFSNRLKDDNSMNPSQGSHGMHYHGDANQPGMTAEMGAVHNGHGYNAPQSAHGYNAPQSAHGYNAPQSAHGYDTTHNGYGYDAMNKGEKQPAPNGIQELPMHHMIGELPADPWPHEMPAETHRAS